jgi:hypothetical protein
MRSSKRSLGWCLVKVFFEIFLVAEPDAWTIFPTTFLWVWYLQILFVLIEQVVRLCDPPGPSVLCL